MAIVASNMTLYTTFMSKAKTPVAFCCTFQANVVDVLVVILNCLLSMLNVSCPNAVWTIIATRTISRRWWMVPGSKASP
eukprot:5997113-Ditylum_brightwellii.AAC.1